MAFRGVDIRETGDRLLFRVLLQDTNGNEVTTGTTNLYLYELQSGGTLNSYDFNDNTFKSTALTTETASMTHRQGNNGTTNTGIWTYALTTLTGFTAGNIYFARVVNSNAVPDNQVREFQFGSGVLADLVLWRGTQPNTLVSGRVDSSVGAMASAVLTATAIATDAITAAKIAGDAIGASEFAQAAADKVWSTAARTLTANTNFNDPSAATIRDTILDRVLSGNHDTADTPGAFLQQLDALISSRSGHSAADVWTSGARTLTANTNFNDPTTAQIRDAILDRVLSGSHDTADTPGRILQDVLDRIGSITGTGDNTILGFFKAALSKTAANPSDIGGTFDPADDALEAIRDRGDAGWTTGSGSGLTPLASGTAQGGTASTIQLAAGETFANDELNYNVVKITSGAGAGQSRLITDYVGSTDTATVSPDWTTTPTATSVYEVVEGAAFVAEMRDAVLTAVKIAADAITSAKIAADAIGPSELATDAIGSAQLSAAAAAEIRDAVLDRVLSGNHDTADTPGAFLQQLDALISSRSSHSAGDVWTVGARTLTANTNFNDPTSAQIRDAILDRVLSVNHETADSIGKIAQDLDARLSAARAGYLDNLNGHTPQSGDSYSRLGAPAGASIAADLLVIDNLVDDLETRLNAVRAGYLDNLNTGGLVASQADVQGITQAQRVRVAVPQSMERPDAGSTDYRIWIYAYDAQHQAEDLDSNPTVTAENNAGTSRSGNLGTVTKPGATTGIYYVDYTVADSHAIEGLIFKIDATEGAVTTQYPAASLVVDTTAVDFTSGDRAKLDELHDNRLTAARASNLDELGAANIPQDVDTLLTRLSVVRAGYLDNLSAGAAALEASVQALNDPSAAQVRDAILDRVLSGNHDLANTVGKILQDIVQDTGELQTDDIPGLITALNDPSATAIRDAILDRVLAANHEVAGSLGKLAQFLDAAISSRSSHGDPDPSGYLDAAVSSRGTADAGDQMALQDGAITAVKIASAALSAAKFATDMSVYEARVWMIDDDAGTTDRWVAQWFKNGAPVTAGITSPSIQVVKAADGTDLVPSTSMSQIGTTGAYQYGATGAERLVSGAAYFAEVKATIDSAVRTFRTPMGRDSSS